MPDPSGAFSDPADGLESVLALTTRLFAVSETQRRGPPIALLCEHRATALGGRMSVEDGDGQEEDRANSEASEGHHAEIARGGDAQGWSVVREARWRRRQPEGRRV